MPRKIFTLLILASAVACGSGEGMDAARVAAAAAAEAEPVASARTQAATEAGAGGATAGTSGLVGLPNERMPADGLLTGGQVTREQMSRLAGMGYTTFVNLRPADEDGTGWEEEFAAGQGLTFIRIPVAGQEDLTRENAGILAGALAETDGKAVVFCKSGNRVGALLALKAHWVDEAGVEEALAIGRESGMTRMEPAIQKILTEQE